MGGLKLCSVVGLLAVVACGGPEVYSGRTVGSVESGTPRPPSPGVTGRMTLVADGAGVAVTLPGLAGCTLRGIWQGEPEHFAVAGGAPCDVDPAVIPTLFDGAPAFSPGQRDFDGTRGWVERTSNGAARVWLAFACGEDGTEACTVRFDPAQ